MLGRKPKGILCKSHACIPSQSTYVFKSPFYSSPITRCDSTKKTNYNPAHSPRVNYFSKNRTFNNTNNSVNTNNTRLSLKPDFRNIKDVIHYTRMLQTAVKRKDYSEALSIAYTLLEEREYLDVRAYHTIFSSFCKFVKLKEATELLKEIKSKGIEVDKTMVNNYLSCLGKSSKGKELIEFFKSEIHLCDATSCYIILDYYTKHQLFSESKKFFEEYKEVMDLDEKEYLKILFINFTNHDILSLKQFIFELIEYCLTNKKFNEISINYAIRICGEYQNYSMIFRILEYMDEHEIKADSELVKRMEYLFKNSSVPVGYWKQFFNHLRKESEQDYYVA